ncbi:polyhydroxyalkanoate synthesis repressor PhaR [Salinarimonas soli]|uniref:Polyhydroxyalkanoate synthesis repressor PhaR n=1 Tax=Salinarimonas soli TaxID=1638099 RepID=A0A5B2VCW6_9HYPH|nr:polyhydroxyalkanoate synthesis repressor PhaR [Salinarimonas soli]KAA2237323.1 polyhydroxyalkanoate synthesis repressor PhaR [Salinarimonas soli]
MPTEKPPIVIKKYANRRLYHTGTSTYVTLEDLAQMVKAGEDFVVYDAKTGDEITRSVLTQIIFEQENKEGGQNLLPVTFLRQLIRFYGDSMQSLVPSYLEVSMNNFAREQQKLRDQIAQAFGPGTFQALDDHVRANMTFFSEAMRMFTPFAARRAAAEMNGAGEVRMPDGKAVEGRPGEPPADIDALKTQMAEMQAKLDALSRK